MEYLQTWLLLHGLLSLHLAIPLTNKSLSLPSSVPFSAVLLIWGRWCRIILFMYIQFSWRTLKAFRKTSFCSLRGGDFQLYASGLIWDRHSYFVSPTITFITRPSYQFACSFTLWDKWVNVLNYCLYFSEVSHYFSDPWMVGGWLQRHHRDVCHLTFTSIFVV